MHGAKRKCSPVHTCMKMHKHACTCTDMYEQLSCQRVFPPEPRAQQGVAMHHLHADLVELIPLGAATHGVLGGQGGG